MPRTVIVDSSEDELFVAANPGIVQIGDSSEDELFTEDNPGIVRYGGTLTYGALTQGTMGNTNPAEVVPENEDRKALILCNCSDTTGYFRIGDSEVSSLNSSNYAFRLLAGQMISFDPPVSTQAIWAICYAASKKVSYQEAT